jgi:hypothetical protein
MMSSLKIAAAIVLALLAMLAAPLLFPPKQEAPPPIAHGMPWQIELPGAGQSRVFGLTLGGAAASTLADARRLAAEAPKLALLAPQDAPPALEADLEAMRANAAKTSHLDSGIRKYVLHESDQERAERLPLAAIAFIPSASLDEAVILQRFGTPAERIRQGETLEHFLYPAQGLDVVLDSKGKEVLQYVAPAEFAKLRAPLVR